MSKVRCPMGAGDLEAGDRGSRRRRPRLTQALDALRGSFAWSRATPPPGERERTPGRLSRSVLVVCVLQGGVRRAECHSGVQSQWAARTARSPATRRLSPRKRRARGLGIRGGARKSNSARWSARPVPASFPSRSHVGQEMDKRPSCRGVLTAEALGFVPGRSLQAKGTFPSGRGSAAPAPSAARRCMPRALL